MRGLAVLAASASAWVLVTGVVPRFGHRIPRFEIRSAVLAIAMFVTVFTLLYGLLDVLPVALAIAVMVAGVPAAMLQRKRASASDGVVDQWPDVLLRVRSSVSAGATLPDAVIATFADAGDTFTDWAERVRIAVLFGGGFRSAMDDIRTTSDDPISDRIFVTLAAANQAGGRRVGEIIGLLGQSVGDEIRLRRAHDSALTEQRWTVNVALIAPWALMCLSIATNPQAKRAFETQEGAVVVAIGFAATTIGWLLAMRTTRLSAAPRLFT